VFEVPNNKIDSVKTDRNKWHLQWSNIYATRSWKLFIKPLKNPYQFWFCGSTHGCKCNHLWWIASV